MLRRSSGSCRQDIGHSAAAHAQQRRSRRARRRPKSASGAATVALADRLVAHHARCACSRPDSYLRRTRVESEGTKNTDRDDRLLSRSTRKGISHGSDWRRPRHCQRLEYFNVNFESKCSLVVHTNFLTLFNCSLRLLLFLFRISFVTVVIVHLLFIYIRHYIVCSLS